MADPRRPRQDLRSTGHLLRLSLLYLRSALFPLLCASLLLFSFRSVLLAGTLRLISAVDLDPAIQSLLSRLSIAEPSPPPSASFPQRHTPPRQRPPFLHLTRVGTLDEDFFSDSDASSGTDGRSFRRGNSTFPSPIRLFLADGALGFPRLPKSNKMRVSETIHTSSPILFSFPDTPEEEEDRDRPVELRIFGRGLDLDRQDAIIILYLLALLSFTHALAILGFLLSYTVALGIVFFAVSTAHLGKPIFLTQTVHSGARMGIRRLIGFVFLWWAARDSVIQFLSIWCFSDIRDQNKLVKLFIKVKLMPFSFTAPSPLTPWSGYSEGDLSGFLFLWALLDAAFSFIFTLAPWLVIMDNNVRRRGADLVKEGCYLVSLLPSQALWIKILEILVCGNLVRRILLVIGGRVFAGVFQSLAEVYFMVAWLVFYFTARSKDGELEGRRFGSRDLEDCINGLR